MRFLVEIYQKGSHGVSKKLKMNMKSEPKTRDMNTVPLFELKENRVIALLYANFPIQHPK